MQNKSVATETLRVLNEVRSQGYIKSENNSIELHYQKANHALAAFFKAMPIDPNDAVACMNQLTEIGKNTDTFFSLFSKTMMDLYDWAATGDTLTQRKAETKLLYFFSKVSPSTVEQKNRLLAQIQKMPDFLNRKREAAKVVGTLVDHYEQNGQFNEDPGLSVMKSLSDLLHEVADSGVNVRHSYVGIREMKKAFCTCAATVKMHAPGFYEDSWAEKFTVKPPHQHNVPDIKEPVTVCPSRVHYLAGRVFSRTWENE